jgi:hypothetical protein
VNERLQRIVQTIGSLTTVTTLLVICHSEVESVPLWLIQSFHFVATLRVYSYSQVGLDYEDLVAGLTGHSSLQNITLRLPTRSYRFVHPVLRTITHLACLVQTTLLIKSPRMRSLRSFLQISQSWSGSMAFT